MRTHFRSLVAIVILATLLFPSAAGFGQTGPSGASPGRSLLDYPGGDAPHRVVYELTPARRIKSKKAKNIILMIGDGMGLAQITAARIANGGSLYLDQFPHTGFASTHSGSHFITDSGAGGTALATGQKTYNGAIGVGMDSIPLANIREMISAIGKSTGVVATSSITHATPAAFVAHQPSREMHEEIALDFVNSGIDLLIGGGLQDFTGRVDSLDMLQMLEDFGYYVDTSTTEPCPKLHFFHPEESGKVAGLYANEHLVSVLDGRGDYLARATSLAIQHLERNSKGFFLMVEGSQIDWGGHDNNTGYVISEMIDFDQAVGEALKFAARDGNTLVIVTSDHETGGFAVMGGDLKTGAVSGSFASGDHSGSLVPVFAFGPGAERFCGIYDNTLIPKHILGIAGVKKARDAKKPNR